MLLSRPVVIKLCRSAFNSYFVYRKVAKDYIGKLVFAISDKTQYKGDLADYGFDSLSDKKAIGVGIQDKSFYYKQHSSFSVENVKKFVDDFLSGSIVGIEKVCCYYCWLSSRLSSRLINRFRRLNRFNVDLSFVGFEQKVRRRRKSTRFRR